MAKSKKLVKIKDPECLNCGYPFSGYEVFCPECGQKNKGNTLTFGSFIKEVFNGFVSWDAKFWTTIFPLLFKPGKVSKDYVEGKRQRYSNPFRFYLTVSILFFLIIGLTNSYQRLQDLKSGKNSNIMQGTNFTFNKNGIKAKNNDVNLDSVQNHVFKQIEKEENRKDSLNRLVENHTISEEKKDSILGYNNNGINFGFGDSNQMGRYMLFHKKNPSASPDQALDSLKIEKTFANRFWYSRAGFMNKMMSDSETSTNFYKQMLSYASIALFILLPMFTLFLRIIYVRRKFTYIEHLVFVFHVQTVFFLLFSVFYLISFANNAENVIPLFLGLFLIYLFIAMKRFYQQGFFKTFFKFMLANFAYIILASLGMVAISFIAFALS